MLHECSSIKHLDLSKLENKEMCDIYKMFDGCGDLEELNLSSFNFEKVNDMKDLFFGCNSLKKLILSENNVNVFKEKMGEKLPNSIEIIINSG